MAIGDAVTATIELDDAERVLEVPDDLAAALDADPRVRAAFDALSFSHRKEHVRAIVRGQTARDPGPADRCGGGEARGSSARAVS